MNLMTSNLISKGIATMQSTSLHTPSSIKLSPMGVLTWNGSWKISGSKSDWLDTKGVMIDKVDCGLWLEYDLF